MLLLRPKTRRIQENRDCSIPVPMWSFGPPETRPEILASMARKAAEDCPEFSHASGV